MNYKALIGIFSLLISSISALAIIDFPLNYRVAPGSDVTLMLEGNDIAAGDHVRVELWDNHDDEDVNAAILGEELIVGEDHSVHFDIPSHFAKTDNAFLRVYYKCHNAVSPRFTIKPAKHCMTTKTPCKPTHVPTPIIIYKPTEAITATPIIIHKPTEAGSGHAGPAGPAVVAIGDHSVTTAVRPTTVKSSVTIISSSTSTSSASVAKISAGSIAIAMAVAVAMLF